MSTSAETGRQRSPDEIRRDIEQHRRELGESIGRLRGDIARATDWRAQIVAHQQQVLIGAAVAGFVIGGGIAVIPRIFRRR
jgi:hypothetical protein